ncbi:MAG: response regulator, partial [Pseudomonadota bacterium]
RFLVLLVEDNPDHAELIRAIVESPERDRHVTAVTSGEAALDYLAAAAEGRAEQPDLVLLDVNMAGINGFDVLRRAKKDLGLLTPIVVLSTSSAPVDIETAMSANANSYTVKSSDYARMELDLERLSDYWAEVNRGPVATVEA